MNEKIAELAKQAGWIEIGEHDFDRLSAQFNQQFAELIIRECAKIADDNYDRGFCPVGNYIVEHFGVVK